jgi:hypothetical protein
MKNHILALAGACLSMLPVSAQQYWQQEVNYTMNVELNPKNHVLTGTQKLVYTNNSNDTLNKVYYHLYYNAFQPGSMMDVRSRSISDPDKRVLDRISKLSEKEIGYQKIEQLTQNGKEVKFSTIGTILKVELAEPILPNSQTTFDMQFEAQVPVQIRRTGRDNMEGIDYTMTQWYPKMAEYDKDGWHPNEYVGREFYGVWGTFDVHITMPSNYIVAGTGVIQNPNEVGHGYGVAENVGEETTWHFKAEKVHDFGWAADPDYVHDQIEVDNELVLHFFYQADTLAEQWKEIQPEIVDIFNIVNSTFGRYPYPVFSVIQGGDGGMEYPMCTMVRGHGDREGKVGLITHEGLHNWYYGVLGTNEYRYPWMDEGMTTYAEEYALMKHYNKPEEDFMQRDYNVYRYLVSTGKEEPMATAGDLFDHNMAYSISSYVKGGLTQNQLRYIVGDSAFYRAVKVYFDKWGFKHPTPHDYLHVVEQESNMELDWFFDHWLNTLHHTDYAVSLNTESKKALVEIKNEGNLPMPVEVRVELTDGQVLNYYIPLMSMRGARWFDGTTLAPMAWVAPVYSFELPVKAKLVRCRLCRTAAATEFVTFGVGRLRLELSQHFGNPARQGL